MPKNLAWTLCNHHAWAKLWCRLQLRGQRHSRCFLFPSILLGPAKVFHHTRQDYNYLLTYDSYGPVYNRFQRGEWITWASGGEEGALDNPGPLNGTSVSFLSGGACVQAQATSLYLFLGSLYHHMKCGRFNRVIINIMHLFLPPPPPQNRCIMLNHTTY